MMDLFFRIVILFSLVGGVSWYAYSSGWNNAERDWQGKNCIVLGPPLAPGEGFVISREGLGRGVGAVPGIEP